MENPKNAITGRSPQKRGLRTSVESAYAEQIEKELRKSVLLIPQFCLSEALRRFSRNLEGIVCPKSCACLMSFQDLSYSFLK